MQCGWVVLYPMSLNMSLYFFWIFRKIDPSHHRTLFLMIIEVSSKKKQFQIKNVLRLIVTKYRGFHAYIKWEVCLRWKIFFAANRPKYCFISQTKMGNIFLRTYFFKILLFWWVRGGTFLQFFFIPKKLFYCYPAKKCIFKEILVWEYHRVSSYALNIV